MLRPDFEELANSFIDEATFAAIDCQKLPETAKEAGITQHPTFQVLHEVSGALHVSAVSSATGSDAPKARVHSASAGLSRQQKKVQAVHMLSAC
jgi:hypothetical protein